MKTIQPTILSRECANSLRKVSMSSLFAFVFLVAGSSIYSSQITTLQGASQPNESQDPLQSHQVINVYGLHLTGVDAEGIEQSFWIALFAGTEEEYQDSWVHDQLNRNGSGGFEGMTPSQIQLILDEVGILEHCFSEGNAEKNCLYYCDPKTKRKVKRICFFRNTSGGLIAVTIDPIIEEGLTSLEKMRAITTQLVQVDHIKEQLEAILGPDLTIVFPEGREFGPNWR